MDRRARQRLTEYIDAASEAALVVEGAIEGPTNMDEFDWCADTLVELLERYNDVAKPKAEEGGRKEG